MLEQHDHPPPVFNQTPPPAVDEGWCRPGLVLSHEPQRTWFGGGEDTHVRITTPHALIREVYSEFQSITKVAMTGYISDFLVVLCLSVSLDENYFWRTLWGVCGRGLPLQFHDKTNIRGDRDEMNKKLPLFVNLFAGSTHQIISAFFIRHAIWF